MNHKEIIHTTEFIDILWDELNVSVRESINTRYANTKINDKVKKDLIRNTFLDALMYWKLQSTKEAKTIGANPTMELAKTRLDNLRKRSDATDLIICAVADYIAKEFEHSMNLGHTDAFIYLNNIEQDSVDLVHPTPINTFEFKGDLKHFYKQCIGYEVIDSKTSLDSFKMAFDGGDLRGFDDFVFKFKQDNHCVYFFDQLDKKKFIHQKYVPKRNMVIEILCNIKNVHSKRVNYKDNKKGGEKEGTPKNIDYINKLINSLK